MTEEVKCILTESGLKKTVILRQVCVGIGVKVNECTGGPRYCAAQL